MSIYGIGTDIVEIKRMKKAINLRRFLEICFTSAEIRLCEGKGDFAYKSFAGHFAAKEAVAKALGTGFRGFYPRDIEILKDEYGRPLVKLSEKVLGKVGLPENISVLVSISHERDYAVAMSIIEIRD